MNKIICPVDFSETSLNAVEFAVEIGRKFHAHLTLLHVFTEEDFNKVAGEASATKSFKELMAMAKNKLEQIVNEINNSYKDEITCSMRFELGELIPELSAAIKDGNYTLLVMGTTGVNRSKGVFFGSNTEEAIDDIFIPILCIPQEASYNGFRKLVYASDFMQEDRLAIQEVISFATFFNARINVLHINISDSDKKYEEFIKELKSFITYSKISFVNRKIEEDIGQGIRDFVKEENADLLVVYKKQRSFVGSLFHKSITKTLSYSSEKPLFVLKLESQ